MRQDKERYEFMMEDRKPIYERVGQMQLERYEKEKLRKQQQHEEERKKLRSAPAISRESQRIVAAMKNRVPITDRVNSIDDQTLMEKEKAKRRFMEVKKEELEDCTFQPQVNPVSKKIVQSKTKQQSFFERQKMYEAREKMKQEYMSKTEQAQYNFKPSISKTSNDICKKNLNRAGTMEDIYDRLTNRDKKRMDHIKTEIAEQYYSKFSFHPTINQVSNVIAAPTDLEELVNNSKSKRIKEELTLKVMEKENYSFQPTLVSQNDKYLQDRKPYAVINEQEKFLKQKEIKRAKALIELECEQLQECTFQPTINEGKPSLEADTPIVIKGLGRHIERRERAKRIEEERRERNEEVFRPKVYSKKVGGATIMEPFSFNYN
ncbi:hypothetical protein NAEGRDRAFT_79903 [Naegleria gruberi]|uniref:Uncharacterized protein n=1 Tax=Naegleria gruberi TaxID=5762 RepID=D2VGM4_NAEGR|nr:uncharacterized protein NAEGRDRAFT_79903 [Naegleria gruberi]EFC43992.1 hypothetical protein NAEGRDRAFT_79903 [Naegleria gruberi]|eukprot:XP_002676736.1 hypothetical protein NAEGRDRAFT_79903 [Naegleria gruberi strain NEG-M]